MHKSGVANMTNFRIREARKADLQEIARINAKVFLGQRKDKESAIQWVSALFAARPVYRYFVAEENDKILGYAAWQWHGGFNRAEPVIELEQLGVDPAHQGQGIGPALVKHGFAFWTKAVQDQSGQVESHVTFTVWCYTLNLNAMKIYSELFGKIEGMRTQYANRAETMFRTQQPIVRPVRND